MGLQGLGSVGAKYECVGYVGFGLASPGYAGGRSPP